MHHEEVITPMNMKRVREMVTQIALPLEIAQHTDFPNHAEVLLARSRLGEHVIVSQCSISNHEMAADPSKALELAAYSMGQKMQKFLVTMCDNARAWEQFRASPWYVRVWKAVFLG